MHTYYIFKINKYFSYIYKKWPNKMYKILEEMYLKKDYSDTLTYKYYERFAEEFNKLELNEYIYSKNKLSCCYERDNNLHFIGRNNYNKLIINNTCLVLITDDINSVFLIDLSSYDDKLFIVDFNNRDYFWIKDRQNNTSLV